MVLRSAVQLPHNPSNLAMLSHPLTCFVAVSLLSLAPTAQVGAATASYQIRFDATWSAASHPGAYPAGAHFSPLIGATHRPDSGFWEPGGISSDGMEQMAEIGATFQLRNEIDALIGAGQAGTVVLGSGIGSPGSTSRGFTATGEFSAVSFVTMVAPSPDWFVGVDGVELFVNGEWVEEVVVELYAWDAGTDSGPGFNSPNSNTNPAQPIALITAGPFQGPGTGEAPLGTFTLTRRDASVEFGTCQNPAGSLALSGRTRLGSSFSLAIHDPGLTMPNPSIALLAFSFSSDAAYPCGKPRANWGLSAPGATGELLLGPTVQVLAAPAWTGSPTSLGFTVPNDAGLVGMEFFAQGALVDPGVRVGLTSGLSMVVGP